MAKHLIKTNNGDLDQTPVCSRAKGHLWVCEVGGYFMLQTLHFLADPNQIRRVDISAAWSHDWARWISEEGQFLIRCAVGI